MDFNKLKQFLKERGEPAFRFTQIQKAIMQEGIASFNLITVLSKELRQVLSALAQKDPSFSILPFANVEVMKSRAGDSFKALATLYDGKCIETVLMNPVKDVWSVCVSCQVGCAMKCAFCATGKMGFVRNLTAEEIWGQVLFWKQYAQKEKMPLRISHVVYMGMGEPFNNIENVFESISALTDKDMFGIGQRNISVSTSGIIPGIEQFADTFPQVNLAISLHSANETVRSDLMPVNKAYNLQKLAEGLKDYFAKTNRQVFVEYILLDGVNDGVESAKELVNYLKGIGFRHLLHVNLIVFNKIEGAKFTPSSKESARAFKDFLIKNGISATIRKSMGQDIAGACGQLAGK